VADYPGYDIKYYLAEDTIDANDLSALADWLKTNPRVTMGPLTKEFEAKWSSWLGRKYSIYCNSGSSANLLMYAAIAASGRLPNKKVIVPSVGWVTTIAPAIQLNGWEPIMCEADKNTFGLDLNCLEALLKKHHPSTVIVVQVLGVPGKMKELMDLKNKYGFVLLEDACAAMGSSYRGQKVGAFGDMSSFSLYFGHQISTIEGGLVSTDDEELYNLMLMIRSHGWTKDLSPEMKETLSKKYNVDSFHAPFLFVLAGFNLRPTDDHAFLGIRQMDKMEWLIRRRMENHLLYKEILGKYFYVQKYEPDSVICSISFGLLAHSVTERRKIIEVCRRECVETRMFSAGNLGLHPFWCERYGKFSAPMADRIHHCGLFLPNNPSLKTSDIEFISDVVLSAVKGVK
jgi:CDP-6-deoxy-D-xylo-4-hexulose-3-dehydrase